MSEPDAKDVAEALAITFEREDAAGAPWCPPHDAQALARWVTDRSRELGGAIRRAVRFARLAAAADGRDHVRFLYVTVPALRARHFSAALTAAAAGERLAPIATLDASGIRLHEPAMRPQSAAHQAGFEIHFAQMPRLAALLDILHNALGYEAVGDLLRPIVGRGPPGQHADEVARALHSAFNRWLAPRLESPHHVRQAQSIRAFLARRGRVQPEAITDASILSFWTAMADGSRDEDVEGFRLYTSAARALLRYRQALFDAAGARELAAPLRFGVGSDDSEVDIERLDPIELDTVEWQSPLVALSSPPANGVKWLTKAERLALTHYLGCPSVDDDGGESDEDASAGDTEKASNSLGGSGRLDLRFARTLLRADVFGAAQASLIAQVRRRVPAATAIEQALAGVGATAYGDRVAAYAALRDQIELEALAALQVLLEARCVEALILISRLGGQNALTGLLPPGFQIDDSDGGPSAGSPARRRAGSADAEIVEVEQNRIAAILQAALAHPDLLPPGATALIAQARAAIRKINRQGFRPQDRTDAAILAAMQAAVAPLLDLLDELAGLTDQLKAIAAADVMSDRAVFAATFQQLYAKGA